MASIRPDGEVVLGAKRSALQLLHALLADATATFPNALGHLSLPESAQRFRAAYPRHLPRFEAARLASEQRQAIGQHLVAALQREMAWLEGAEERPLVELLREPVVPLPLQVHEFAAAPGWRPSIVYRGERWEAARLSELGALLTERGVVTSAVGGALDWLGQEVLDAGLLQLSGRKIAVLGAGAEMASTRLWLEAGADVLWLDVQPPPRSWWQSGNVSGRLFWPTANVDLLTQPREVLATILDFAAGAPVDIALYAYAPGRARELRLTATMNAIVDALPPALVASVTMLVSPTTPTELLAEDLRAMRTRREQRPAWEGLCARLGLLGRGDGAALAGVAACTRTVVGIQGASYQAAQYLCKVLTAECWAAGRGGDGQAMRVSANTAAITRTRSLAHPVFAAAFGGAAALGVETLAPGQSRRFNGLLAVHDWLHPEQPVPGRLRVHGGIHTLPYPLESALRVAAAIGFARSPRLLGGLLRR